MKSTDPHGNHTHPDPDMPEGQGASQSGTGPTSIDPVCGMTVTLKPDTRTEAFGGKDFHFCSGKCQTKFQADPWFYASGRAAGRKKAAPANVQYTCPMHPEIIRDVPGSCPICGMALEPERLVHSLSIGERQRVEIIRCLMQDIRLLILDEPTNDLDLPTLRLLEEALADFGGCILVVSHDRYFLDRVCDRVLAFEDGGVFIQPGNF